MRADGGRVLLGVYVGGRESTESWKGALQTFGSRDERAEADYYQRQPWTVPSNKGGDAWISANAARRTKTRNVLARVKRSRQAEGKRFAERYFPRALFGGRVKSGCGFSPAVLEGVYDLSTISHYLAGLD